MMKKFIKYILLITVVAFISSCMEEVGDYTVNGEAITGFELVGPDNNDTVKINTGALSETFVFEWNAAESGLGSSIIYTILFDVADGDFSNPVWSKQADNSGSATKATLSFDELKQIHDASEESEVASLKWNVKAENGSPNVNMGQVASFLKIALTSDGLSNFDLVSPLDKSLVQMDGAKENDALVFDWDDATSTSGNVIYKFYIDELGGDFSDPLLILDADDEGATSKITRTHAEWKSLLEQNAIEEGAYIWTVKAISTDLEWKKNVYEIYFEFVNWSNPIYIVGEATTVGWNIDNALEMTFVAPNIWVGTYELKAGKDFKFFPKKGSWDNGIGADRFENFIGCSDPGNGNITNSGSENGIYFVIVDLNSKTLTVSDAPKILGGSVAADWSPENSVSMQMIENGIWDTYQYITVDGWGFKFVPERSGWDGDFGKSKTLDGFLDQADEDNITVEEDGFYRVRANTNDFSYSVIKTDWGIIGSATPGGWDNDTNMTFTNVKGDYIWSADITLTDGDIKFRANDGWDINLGDTGKDGTLEYGGDDITVTAGEYHIELNLNSSTGFTYTITAK
nr:SusF/SusE family outer membrane protein [uncultured Draconibacterium sp.]